MQPRPSAIPAWKTKPKCHTSEWEQRRLSWDISTAGGIICIPNDKWHQEHEDKTSPAWEEPSARQNLTMFRSGKAGSPPVSEKPTSVHQEKQGGTEQRRCGGTLHRGQLCGKVRPCREMRKSAASTGHKSATPQQEQIGAGAGDGFRCSSVTPGDVHTL